MADPMTEADVRAALITTAREAADLEGLAVDLGMKLKEAEAELDRLRTTETDVTWLAAEVCRIINTVSVRTDKSPESAQYTIAREVESLINAGILTDFISGRVVGLAAEHIKQTEAELDRLRAKHLAVHTEMMRRGETLARRTGERDAARAEGERLTAELADTVGEARSDIAGLETLVGRLRIAWESARRGRREVRDQLRAARPYIHWLHKQRRELFAKVEQLRAELEDLAARQAEARTDGA